MQYKTIALELLEQQPKLHTRLRQQRKLLATLERCSEDLQANHEKWKRELFRRKPESDPSQIASEALELAVEQLQNRLSSEPQEEEEAVSTKESMASLPRHLPPE